METKSPKPKAAAPPGSRSWISTAKDPAYWQALGEFIEAFASAELLLFNYLVMHAAIPHSTARVLLPEIRADRIVDCIRAVWNVRTPDVHIRQELDVALAQVKEINKRRNSMVHNVSLVTSDKGRISSNITRAFTHKCPKEYRVAPDIIRDMIADLEKISAHVVYALIIIAEPRTSLMI
jgi:hypothetical protein